MTSPTPFVVTARGRTHDQTSFVTDGSLILREDALRALGAHASIPPGTRELTTAQIENVLGTRGEAVTDLDALVPSRLYPNTYRTGDDVAIGARYVELLRVLPGPVRCATSGPRGPIMLFDLQGLLGALMPVATIPENAERLPSPSVDARRGRVLSLAHDGSGTLGFVDGRASFSASVLHGVVARDLVVDGLLDCDVEGVTVRAAWPAGTARPATVAPPPPLRWPRAVVLRSLQMAGLLGEFDGGSFARLLQKVSPAADLAALLRDEPLDETEILLLLAAHYGHEPGSRAACRDRLVLPWEREQGTAEAGLARVLAGLGLSADHGRSITGLAVAADVLDDALRAAARTERVWVVGRRAPFLLVRDTLAEIGPTVGARVWRSRS